MKPRDLLPIVDRVRRATTNRDVLTVCDALSERLRSDVIANIGETAAAGSAIIKEFRDAVAKLPKPRGMPRTAMDAVVEHAEDGRKPARGKAKRAIARKMMKATRK